MGTSVVVRDNRGLIVTDGDAPAVGGSVFDRLSYTMALQFLAKAQRAEKGARKFMEGDHWQRGEGWIGPHPPVGETGYQQVMDEIAAAFTFRNMILEVVDRHMQGVVGLEPAWGFTPKRAMKKDEKPSDAEQKLIDELEAVLTDWWDKRNLHEIIQKYVTDMKWAGRSSLRLYTPAGVLDEVEENGERFFVASADSVEDALMRFLYVEHPEPEASTVFTDPDTQQKVGVTKYNESKDWVNTGQEIVELCYVDPDTKETVIRRLNQRVSEAYAFQLGERLTLWESEDAPMVTKALITAQKALNLSLSMLPRNVVTGGFLERVLLNAQLPGEWILNDKGERVGFKPSSYKTGSGTTNFVTGAEYKDESGNTRLATPSIQWRPPSDTEPVIKTADTHYEQGLAEAKQVHILIAGEAAPSGYSREQARADFKISLTRTAARVQPAVRWLLETAAAFAEVIAGQPGLYTETLRATCDCRIDTGPISVEERAQNVAEYQEGLLSEEEAMSRNGVADTDAELARIQSSPHAKLKLLDAQADTIQKYENIGFTVEDAAEMVGLDQEWIDRYTEANQFDPTDEEGNPIDTKTGKPLEPVITPEVPA